MANEVNITITGKDLSGPAFDSVLRNLAELRAELAALGNDLGDMGNIKIDTGSAMAALTSLRSKIQALGIADLADVNVQPGRLTAQLQLLKRLISQAGINDLLDVNVNKPELSAQLRSLADMSETIPLNFKVGPLPELPQLGEGQSITDRVSIGISESDVNSLEQARQAFRDLGVSMNQVTPIMELVDGSFMKMGLDAGHARDNLMAWTLGLDNASAAMAFLDGSILQEALDQRAANQAMADSAIETAKLRNEMMDLTRAIADDNTPALIKFNDAFTQGIPLWQSTGGWWGALTGHVSLFGGALNGVLPAFIATASGLHLLIDGTIELAATLIPATIAFAAFAGAAVPTVQSIITQMQNLKTTNDALGTSLYPLTGGFQAMANAVQPEVYVLFGEGLDLIQSKTNVFTQVAVGAGKVIDDLGARFVAAATSGQGFGIFLHNAVGDLATWGDFIGNLGAVIGNFLKAMPGYAEVILHALDDVSKALETITGSAFGQWVINLGLAFHGAVLYIGLLATGAAYLLSGSFGLIGRTAIAIGGALDGVGVAGTAAATGLTEVGVAAERAQALPWGWITIAATAIGVLAFALSQVKDPAQQFNDSMQKLVQNSSLLDLSRTITIAANDTSQKLAPAMANLTQALANQGPAATGAATRFKDEYSPAVEDAARKAGELQSGLSTLDAQQQLVSSRVAEVANQFHLGASALGVMNAAGITSAQITDTNAAHWAAAKVEIQAYIDSLNAMSLGQGRSSAAMNALNFSAGAQSNALGQVDQAMTKVIQGQDSLINTVLSGETAFNTYATAINQSKLSLSPTNGLAAAAAVAGASIDGLNNQSLNLSQTFFGSAVPAAQKVIDALQQQSVSTADLTTVIATQAGQLLTYAGNSDTAKAAIIAMINNALGPGTVSMQNLNQWVGQNTTTMAGFKSIVDKAEISAGALANVLSTQLNQQFQNELLRASGADQAIKIYTDDLVHNQQTTAAGVNDRNRLITDLENAGFSASKATNFVDGLSRSIGKLPGNVNTNINVSGSGSGGVQIVTSGAAASGAGGIRFVNFASGGILTGGRPGMDSIPIMGMPGEVMIPVDKVAMMAPALKAAGIPGFAQGGIIGLENGIGGIDPYSAQHEDSGAADAMATGIKAAMDAAKAAVDAAAAASASASAGPGGGSPVQNQALARQMMPSWSSGLEWGMWQALWNQESGWNQYAYNASSGATGIPQALPYTKMPQAAWLPSQGGQANPHAQIGWGIGYIQGRYGDPITAEQHELAYNWYDNGGWMPPGRSIAMNGTGHSEWVPPPNGGFPTQLEVVSGGNSAFEAFMLEMIRNFVRLKGGGSAQKAFGKPGVK